jgi:hypothetical protein
MRVLVCGDRRWEDRAYLVGVLDGIHASQGISVLIEGEAHGADTMAAAWARGHGIVVLPFTADWAQHGRAAGIIRNNAMLRYGKPELVVAFHPNILASKGTGDMVARARKAGVECWIFAGSAAPTHGVAVLPSPDRVAESGDPPNTEGASA